MHNFAYSVLSVAVICLCMAAISSAETDRATAVEGALGTTHTSEKREVALVVPQGADQLHPQVTLPGGVLFGVFKKEDGPFLITDNVVVPSGQLLEFGPGSVIYIGGEYTTITVFGQIFARGTSAEPIIFRSAKRDPKPWDWDRIYCRSRNLSIFEHCTISHANYGVFIENGSASITHSVFNHNSLYGVVVKNGDLAISASRFTGGHIIALNLLEGARASADSLFISENVTAVSCARHASFRLSSGAITANGTGIIADDQSFIEIVGAEITHNKNGVIATSEIPKRMREIIFNNSVAVKIASPDEMAKLLKEPVPVKPMVLPATITTTIDTAKFIVGFSALNTPREAATSFIGNVTTGFSFFNPTSTKHPKERDTTMTFSMRNDHSVDTIYHTTAVVRQQSKYPGEEAGAGITAGVQPEIQFFANGRRGDADINLLMDLYSNQWLSTSSYLGKNIFNLSMNYAKQSLVVGDFFESGSETALSGRQLTGLKYTGDFFDRGRGEKRLHFKLAAGQTEAAKDSGDHEVFVYNQSVDTGMSIRQQITYIAELTLQPTRNSSVLARGIIARDQVDKPIFSSVLLDPAAPDPVISQTGCIAGSLSLLDSKLELTAEIDLGSADTIVDSSSSVIAWYNPKIEKALPNVISLFNSNNFLTHYATNMGVHSLLHGYTTDIRFLKVAPTYYAAGDPYIVTNRSNVKISCEKPVTERFNLSGYYEFDRSSLFSDQMLYASLEELEIDTSKTDLNILSVAGELETGEYLPTFTASYTAQFKKADATETTIIERKTYSIAYLDRELSNRFSLEGKQSFTNGLSYSVRYQLLFDNDYGAHPNLSLLHEGNRLHNALSSWFAFKVTQMLRNKTTVRIAFKHENRDSLQAWQYKVANQLSVQLIPRKLSCSLSGEYSRKNEFEFGETVWLGPVLTDFYLIEFGTRYSFTSHFSSSLMTRYEKSYDEIAGTSENYKAIIAGFHITYLF